MNLFWLTENPRCYSGNQRSRQICLPENEKSFFFNNSKYLPSVESKSVSLFWEAVLVVPKNETEWCHPMPFLLSIVTHHMGAMLLTIGDVCKWVRGCDWGQVEWKRSSTLIIEKCIPVKGLGDFPKGKKKVILLMRRE